MAANAIKANETKTSEAALVPTGVPASATEALVSSGADPLLVNANEISAAISFADEVGVEETSMHAISILIVVVVGSVVNAMYDHVALPKIAFILAVTDA